MIHSRRDSTHSLLLTMSSFRPLFLALVGLLLVVSTLAGTSEDGLKWLAQKKLEDGVVVRDSGLMYKELKPANADGKRL